MSRPPPKSPQSQPHASAVDAEQAARLHYGLQTTATRLEGDQELNFKLQTPSKECYVLKFHGPTNTGPALQEQARVLQELASRELGMNCPQVLPNLAGELLTPLDGGGALRLLTWIEGTQLVEVKPHTPFLMENLGAQMARLGLGLARIKPGVPGLTNPSSSWNLLAAGATIGARLDALSTPERRERIAAWLVRIQGALARASRLPSGLIHNDANDHNLLVEALRPGVGERKISGLIDFGDLSLGPRVIDVATAAAYACLGKRDPLGAIAQVARGYHSIAALDEDELELLPLLSVARLCLSVSMSAQQQAERPENQYLSVSEAPAWQALALLEPLSNGLLEARVRDACGLPASQACGRIAKVLPKLRPSYVLPEEFYRNVVELDLSIGNLDLSYASAPDPEQWNAQIRSYLSERGASLGVGCYDEARLCYTGPSYALPGEDRELRRSVHLGIDLFAPAGTPVRAPLQAKVHGVHDNLGAQNYGPTVILEHRMHEECFYSLYGHLGRGVLSTLKVGQTIQAGEAFAELGTIEENGGWPPHLHIQWILDPLGTQVDFPGVAAPEERSLWLALSPDPSLLAGLSQSASHPHPELAAMLKERSRHTGAGLSLSYQTPLNLVRGAGVRLIDAQGRGYLDAVNNVPHVGHGHPHLVQEACRQMSALSTNTRYLDSMRQRYMRRLCERFPEPLSVCYLVCSGSEANELALRLARAHSGKRGVAVLSAAYHGNTSSLVELSPYKFSGAGGEGCADHVQVVDAPDGYRGQWKTSDPDCGQRYGELLLAALESGRANGHPIGAFFAESLLGCAGQIPLPAGYLREAYRHVRAAGGACIADEVQVGFGRVGSHFWGFELQDVVPDIVTLGKPMGNGHPLAGVITTPEIAASFDKGMEYFNTFGGNPVSAAVGNAVLDVIESEGLQQNALKVGDFLRRGFEALKLEHAIIGDVRGAGLFLGIELVHDRASLEPAGKVANYVAQRMCARGILISTDGPLHNVLKIKPPLVFSQADAEQLLAALSHTLAEDPAQPQPHS